MILFPCDQSFTTLCPMASYLRLGGHMASHLRLCGRMASHLLRFGTSTRNQPWPTAANVGQSGSAVCCGVRHGDGSEHRHATNRGQPQPTLVRVVLQFAAVRGDGLERRHATNRGQPQPTLVRVVLQFDAVDGSERRHATNRGQPLLTLVRVVLQFAAASVTATVWNVARQQP
jgi:hypothetical protein